MTARRPFRPLPSFAGGHRRRRRQPRPDPAARDQMAAPPLPDRDDLAAKKPQRAKTGPALAARPRRTPSLH